MGAPPARREARLPVAGLGVLDHRPADQPLHHDGPRRPASAGSYLRSWYGPGYRSIGFTFDHGTIGLAPGETTPQAAPEPGWFERPLGDQQPDRFVLDLRGPAPSPVRAWLTASLITRGIPNAGPGATISGGTLAQWFDVLVHVQTVTPQDALS